MENSAIFASKLPRQKIKPFLKWAGGKNRIISDLLKHVPNLQNARYHEPFVGGGALFFALADRMLLGVKKARLSDSNYELILTYQMIRDRVNDVVDALYTHYARKNDKEHYYQVRSVDPISLSDPQRAARFIYLNKTCFNGLFRENRKGQFNVPFGYYTKPAYLDTNVLFAANVVLQDVEIEHASFEKTLEVAQPGDFVYFDPPYLPLSKTAKFVNYQAKGFSADDHMRLLDVAQKLAQNGVKVLLSNAITQISQNLYQGFKTDLINNVHVIGRQKNSTICKKEFLVVLG